MRIITLGFLFLFKIGSLLAQDLKPFLIIKTNKDAQILFLNESNILTLQETDANYLIGLLDEKKHKKDEFVLAKKKRSETKSMLYQLGKDRFLLTTGRHSYNFSTKKGEIKLTHVRPFPEPPRGAVKGMFFLDGEKSVAVFLNAKEQYNIYIDSAGIPLNKKETFNTSHIGNMAEFAKKKTETPDFVYSYQYKELFFHLPTDVSFLSLDLIKNKIDIGLIYMEYKQSYVFRRYYDQVTAQRYAVKQDKGQQYFFSAPSFGVADFSTALDRLKNPVSIKYTPEAVVNGQLLIKQEDKIKKQGLTQFRFYLIPVNSANQTLEHR